MRKLPDHKAVNKEEFIKYYPQFTKHQISYYISNREPFRLLDGMVIKGRFILLTNKLPALIRAHHTRAAANTVLGEMRYQEVLTKRASDALKSDSEAKLFMAIAKKPWDTNVLSAVER